MPTVEIAREFNFEAAHWLPNVPEGHKCGRMHGHSYRVIVTVKGSIGEDGMLLDFAVIKAAAAPVIAMLDHSTLNDTLPNPTSELLAVWLWNRLIDELPDLSAVMVCETASTSCTYRGEASA